MFSQKSQIERYKRLRRRQPTTGWTPNYQPGIRATREEAPSVSRAVMISERNRFGRSLHAHSQAEFSALMLALFNPEVFDIREQFVMHPGRTVHPLYGHARSAGVMLPDLPGLLTVLEKLGALSSNSILRIPSENDEAPICVPDLWVADLLISLEDERGPFSVHWTVKNDPDGFRRPFPSATNIRNSVKAKNRFDVRMAAEDLYFAAAEIRTQRVSGSQISRELSRNLEDCFSWSTRQSQCEPPPAALSALLLTVSLSSASPLDIYRYSRSKWSITSDTFKTTLFGLVWHRKLRVDLFSRLLFDRPWPVESKDPLAVYADFFRR